MSEFLTEMAETAVRRARETKQSASVSGLRHRLESAPPPLPLPLAGLGFDVIAEVKLASPSHGPLLSGDGGEIVVDLAGIYVAAGAIAVSVLTEESRFRGHLRHLEAVASTVPAPVMRKDFLVDPIQIDEGRAAGASGVLLIARLLSEAMLAEMTDHALAQGMFVVVEVFDRSDLETAATVFDRDVVVGVNSRDLATLRVDESRFRRLAPHLPDHLPAVAESGLQSDDDAGEAARLGYRLALVGSSLVMASAPADRLAAMIASGRSVLAGSR